jgi:hypothetical protein
MRSRADKGLMGRPERHKRQRGTEDDAKRSPVENLSLCRDKNAPSPAIDQSTRRRSGTTARETQRSRALNDLEG